MRDRLEELRKRAQDYSEAASENSVSPSVEVDNYDSMAAITPQAVMFEEEPVIKSFLFEAQRIRDDITVLDIEVIYLNVFSKEYAIIFIDVLCNAFMAINGGWIAIAT